MYDQFPTARSTNPQKLLELVRTKWAIENSLHYRRNVTFREDATRTKRKSAAWVPASLNNLVIATFISKVLTIMLRQEEPMLPIGCRLFP